MGAFSKICGLRHARDIEAARKAGARYGGFAFFEKSPRHLDFTQAAALSGFVSEGLQKVALSVDPSDAFLEAIIDALSPDWVQLHGQESPARVGEIKARFRLPVVKAIGVSKREDLEKLTPYLGVADKILIDAKAQAGATLPGGNGLRFDWHILENFRPSFPWMLAGGLNPDNVAEAVLRTYAPEVDVSSGVEDRPGEKNPDKIRDFVANALGAENG